MPHPTKKPWTFLAYIAGDNDLSDDGLEDIDELCQTGANENVHAAVQIDTYGEHDGSLRYQIDEKEDPADARAYRTVISRLREKDSGDPKVLKEFLKWGTARYPSDQLLCVIWNHGSGFRAVRRDIAYDDFGSSLDMPEVTTAFERAGIGPGKRRIDVLGFDACLMNMLEIAHHFSEHADVLVGSQQTEPGDGWPYNKVLAAMHPNPSPQDLGARIVETYIADYKHVGLANVTQSAISVGKTEGCVRALKELGAELAAGYPANRKGLRAARRAVQTYEYADYVDLDHLARLIADNVPAAAAQAQRVRDTLAECVIKADKYGPDVANSHGLSVWFPTSATLYGTYRSKYLQLRCNRGGSGWVDFLDAYFDLV